MKNEHFNGLKKVKFGNDCKILRFSYSILHEKYVPLHPHFGKSEASEDVTRCD